MEKLIPTPWLSFSFLGLFFTFPSFIKLVQCYFLQLEMNLHVAQMTKICDLGRVTMTMN